MDTQLTERQLREIEYHRDRARKYQDIVDNPLSWGVLENPGSRWWNATWRMFYHLEATGVTGKNVLVIGCGFGGDALVVSKSGANVSAFDISPESIEIAKKRAAKYGLAVDFMVSPAEHTPYPSGYFDVVIARDILHHVEIDLCMREIRRVAKPDATFIANEIYTHTLLERLRRSYLIDKVLYPRMRSYIYRNPMEDYITEDEEKLTQRDVRAIQQFLEKRAACQYFNFLVSRIIPKGSPALAKLDRLLLKGMGPVGSLFAGRVLICGKLHHSLRNQPNPNWSLNSQS
jgi:ubiquinone/menaquinone biosynthesis C-methylase UbiE